MMKILISGILATVTGLGASHLASHWKLNGTGGGVPVKQALESKKTRQISVPVIHDGALQGYLVAQFMYLMDMNAIKANQSIVELFVADEVFRVLYGSKSDFRKLEKVDLSSICVEIKEGVRKRLGEEIVTSIMVHELNYVSKEEIKK